MNKASRIETHETTFTRNAPVGCSEPDSFIDETARKKTENDIWINKIESLFV